MSCSPLFYPFYTFLLSRNISLSLQSFIFLDTLSPTPLHSHSLARFLFPSLYLSCPEAHVSLLALHTITSIHQLSVYSSLATPLPFYPLLIYDSRLQVSLHPLFPIAHYQPLHNTQISPSPYQMSPKLRGCSCGEERNKRPGWW